MFRLVENASKFFHARLLSLSQLSEDDHEKPGYHPYCHQTLISACHMINQGDVSVRPWSLCSFDQNELYTAAL